MWQSWIEFYMREVIKGSHMVFVGGLFAVRCVWGSRLKMLMGIK